MKHRYKLKYPALKLSENDVERQICDFMALRGYEAIRWNSGLYLTPDGKRRVRIGVKGCADWIFVHPTKPVVFIEAKAPGETADPDQLTWLDYHRRCGYTCWVIDSLDELQTLYKGLGL